MSKNTLIRRLRPFLSPRYQCPSATRAFTSHHASHAAKPPSNTSHDYEKRITQLEEHASRSQWYPRLSPETATSRVDNLSFYDRYHGKLENGQSWTDDSVVLIGRIKSLRTAGSKLCFMDIGGARIIQAVVDFSRLQQAHPNMTMDGFKAFCKSARRGDCFSVSGHPHRTARGQLSILASELPSLLSPSLHQVPETLDDAETRARHPHVDMLVNPAAIQTVHVRHVVEMSLIAFFDKRGFIKVNTPILGAGVGGAAARPFETAATEFAGEKLSLRIAPELWLKRLIVGGLDKIYEIGPAFRNEGVDATHNPEFNICEFYQAYATLNDLIEMTEILLKEISQAVESREEAGMLSGLNRTPIELRDFPRLEFIPALEQAMNCKLPNLQSSDAEEQVMSLCRERQIPIPHAPTLPRLLDTLSAYYLEPQSCQGRPTFITHHPACMSPLSKHFECEQSGQKVAARAELFIDGREYANMYEEENSPFEQRRKFEEQILQRKVDSEAMDSDETYLQALEWGLPPTGGWGCGMDRLVMLFAGRERIADVLPFGSLRNVVGLGRVIRR